MSRPVTDDDDGGLRDLLIDLVDLIEGRSMLGPSEIRDVVELAIEEGHREVPMTYALIDCTYCRHIRRPK